MAAICFAVERTSSTNSLRNEGQRNATATARRSPVLFAFWPLAAGERLIEYKGDVTNWRRAAARQQSATGHTFVFDLSSGRVIDGSRGGNSARYLNHACMPNCEAIAVGNRVFIHALVNLLDTKLPKNSINAPEGHL